MRLDLDAIKARTEAATPGPWRWNSYDDGYESVRNELEGVLEPDGGESRYRAISVSEADAAFIAHARTDVPTLLARLAQAEAFLDAWCAAAEDGEALGPLRAQTLEWLGGGG